MMTVTALSGGGAGRLGFVALATEAFAFLLRLGFAVVRREGTLVRFESDSVFVNVYHGRSSYQVGLELGRVGKDELYSLYEVLRAVAPSELQRAHRQATEREVLRRTGRGRPRTLRRPPISTRRRSLDWTTLERDDWSTCAGEERKTRTSDPLHVMVGGSDRRPRPVAASR
jgi:hypothetical protein